MRFLQGHGDAAMARWPVRGQNVMQRLWRQVEERKADAYSGGHQVLEYCVGRGAQFEWEAIVERFEDAKRALVGGHARR